MARMRLAGLLVFPLLAPILGGIASAATGPSAPALEWLRSVASGRTDPAEGTALSDNLTRQRRDELRRDLTRLKSRLRPDDLRPLDEKKDGDLAGVIVSQVTGFDSTTIQIHAVAMVKREGKWLPAPSPASFDGVGLLFNDELRRRARALEDWMIRARGEQFARLRENIHSHLADEMRRAVDPDLLSEGQPEAMAEAFVEACRQRSIPAALALTGGLETPFPSDWGETVQAITRAFDQELSRHPAWRLLAAPDALRAVVHHEQTKRDGMVSVVALDPGTSSALPLRPRAIHLPLERTASHRWRIRLPEMLRLPALDPGRAAEIAREDAVIDADLIRRFPGKLRERYPAAPRTEARAAADALLAALQDPTPAPIVPLLDLSGDPAASEAALIRCVRWWRELRARNDLRSPLLLDFRESGREACAIVQQFSAASPAPAELSSFFFRRDDAGWLADSDLPGDKRGPDRDDETLSLWVKETRHRLAKGWAADIVIPTGDLPPDSAPPEASVRGVIGNWQQALEKKNPHDLLRLCAHLPGEDSLTRALRRAGQELLFADRIEILGVSRSGRWTGVSLRATSRGSLSHPLLILATTPDGPRVLPELDLAAPATRPREFLNNGIFERVAALLPREAVDELRSLSEQHREVADDDRTARPEPTPE